MELELEVEVESVVVDGLVDLIFFGGVLKSVQVIESSINNKERKEKTIKIKN